MLETPQTKPQRLKYAPFTLFQPPQNRRPLPAVALAALWLVVPNRYDLARAAQLASGERSNAVKTPRGRSNTPRANDPPTACRHLAHANAYAARRLVPGRGRQGRRGSSGLLCATSANAGSSRGHEPRGRGETTAGGTDGKTSQTARLL